MRKTTMLNMGAFRLNYLVIALAAAPNLVHAYWDQDGCFHEEYGGVTCSDEATAKKEEREEKEKRAKEDYDFANVKIGNTTVDITVIDPATKLPVTKAVTIGNDLYKLAEKLVTGAINSSSGISGLGQVFKNWKGGGTLIGSVTGSVLSKTDPGYGRNYPGRSQAFWEFQFTVEELACIKAPNCASVKIPQMGTQAYSNRSAASLANEAIKQGKLWELLHFDPRFRFYRSSDGSINVAYNFDGSGLFAAYGGEFTTLFGLNRITDFPSPAMPSAEVLPLSPQDIINNSPLLLSMQRCYKLNSNDFKNCVADIFKPVQPATQINVDKYGLINPGPSGSYAQGFQDYAYTFDPSGVSGVPNPLIFVNLQGSSGSTSGQLFNLGAGLVQVNVGGSLSNGQSNPVQFDCSLPNAFLFPECGFKTAGPGVDPSKITYPSDEVIQFARSRVNAVTSTSIYGTPSCSTGYTDGYRLQWVINNSGCNINSSVITLTGNNGNWPANGLLTSGEQAAAKAQLEARKREIANQPRPDLPNEIPYQVYQNGWIRYAMPPPVLTTSFDHGVGELYRDPATSFYYSLNSDGAVECTKPGIYNSTVDCKRSVGLSVLDILYDYNVYRGRPTANLLLSELGSAASSFSSNWRSRNDAALLTPSSSSGSVSQSNIDPLDTLAPNGAVSWAISSMARQCGSLRNVITPNSYTDARGHAWTATCDGVLTDSRTGYKWKLDVPQKPVIDAAPIALLQDVLLQNASNGLMISQAGSTGVFQSLPLKTNAAPVAQQWRLQATASVGLFKVVQSSTGNVLTPVGDGRAGVRLMVAPDTNNAQQLWRAARVKVVVALFMQSVAMYSLLASWP
jgi:hypothetical protein